jgi:hypothetical protein
MFARQPPALPGGRSGMNSMSSRVGHVSAYQLERTLPPAEPGADVRASNCKLPLRARVEGRVDFFQARVIDVGVDLRRGDAGVAQHFLHLSQVGAARQQMRGKAVS